LFAKGKVALWFPYSTIWTHSYFRQQILWRLLGTSC
jgi:hypothetical protein